ncbi:MAG: hypothetical protein ACK40T_06875 [Akkermansiaceae bacterium]|jgi:hypothetical protein
MKPRKSIIIAIVFLLAAAVLVWWNSGNNSPSAKPENASASEPNGAHRTTQAPHPSAADRIREQPQRPNRPHRPSPTPISLPTDTNEIRNLTLKEARELVRRHKEKGELSLNGLTSLNAETAAVLAEFKGVALMLNGMTTLSEESAAALAGFKGEHLHLGLTTLSPEAARILAKRGEPAPKNTNDATGQCGTKWFGKDDQEMGRGKLAINHLTTLTDESAREIAQFRGLALDLNGLTTLSEESAKGLAAYGGVDLSLKSITTLTPEIATVLAEFKGPHLWLGLTTLDADAVTKLAGFKCRSLHLSGLTTVTPEAATMLEALKGNGPNIIRPSGIVASTQAQ